MPIDYGGQSAEIIEINEIAQKHGLSVIEDAAQSFGRFYGEICSCFNRTLWWQFPSLASTGTGARAPH